MEFGRNVQREREMPGDIRQQSFQVGVLVTAARRAAIATPGARGDTP